MTNRCEQQVKVIPAGGGPIAPFAGTGTAGTSGDGGPALLANIVAPDGVAVDAMGRVFFTNSQFLGFLCGTPTGTESVRYVDTSGIIHTFVSTLPVSPPLFVTYGLHFGFDGTLFVGEAGAERVFAVDPLGTVKHVAGRPISPIGIHSGYGGLATRARSRQLKPDEVQGGTFSITNFGSFGSVFATPVINQPQVAILGAGVVQKEPVVIDDAIAIRSMSYLALTFDHRLIDGALADQFTGKVKSVLENWSEEVL